ncbi:hypothetical protein bas20_0075 [Escherichia phage FritzHoffmann]|nr:hypothetical protein bas19_0075 [Escherichia phage ChristophMerian]QXV79340.1 hypothetical protein bas20_0075 [Escherichia phage FritzHoffmann]
MFYLLAFLVFGAPIVAGLYYTEGK